MKVRIKNLGILKHAEFSLGDLTIICGENNTGKTYATYALYGFLESWRRFVAFPVNESQIHHLLTDGTLKIELSQYIETAEHVLAETSQRYSKALDDVFAAPEGRFGKSEFHIKTGTIDFRDREFKGEIGTAGHDRILTYTKEQGCEEVAVTLALERGVEREVDPIFAERAIRLIISNAIFRGFFPNPFISSAERTGVAIFRKELNFARNRLLEEMGRADQKTDPRELLFKAYQSYPQPIEDNVDFIRQLEDIAKKKSFVAKEHSDILEGFVEIIGGDYAIAENDQLHYTPKGTRLKLTMDQSSSAVRSLLDIGFYLRHIARKGDLLMVDEPELNLHPANQRRIARLFARLVNLGVKVFITTHSDYIIKELNTLIMLNHDKPHLKRIAQENGYRQSELIRSDQVKVYMAREELMPLEEGQKRRRRGHTLVEADIDPVLGIEAPSFDETIDEMNKIVEDIVWGAE